MAPKASKNKYPMLAPRVWHGMQIRDYLKLLARHEYKISPSRMAMAGAVGVSASLVSMASLFQKLVFGRKIEAVEVTEPPIFIIGHWRSGTTHLHELLTLDENLTFPNTYECMAPEHFIVTNVWIPFFIRLLLPKKRPMDNMAFGLDRPQEDEFALCAMGAPTPYYRMAFPNEPYEHLDLLEMANVDRDELKRFGDAVVWFVKALTYSKKKRLIMKSPPHTGRLEILSQLFPGAKFVHITRNPLEIVPSMMRTWRALDEAQGFQVPAYSDTRMRQFVFSAYEKMYRGFRDQKERIPRENLYELRFEDLVKDPVKEVEEIYRSIELPDFESMKPRLEKYLSSQKDYQQNKHEMDPVLKGKIQESFHWYIDTYGYGDVFAPSQAQAS